MFAVEEIRSGYSLARIYPYHTLETSEDRFSRLPSSKNQLKLETSLRSSPRLRKKSENLSIVKCEVLTISENENLTFTSNGVCMYVIKYFATALLADAYA